MQTASPPWDDLRILLAVHRGKSFLAAGKSLGIATSTVARRIVALERALGRTLVHRGNAGTLIAPEAAGLIELGEQMELGLEAMRRDARDDRVAGTVRISVSEGMARATTRVLARVRVKHPALAVELISESRIADIARREADIGIRITRSGSRSLVEKLAGRGRLGLFAARSYVERRVPGARLRRDEAARHDWVGHDQALERMASQRWVRAYGATRFVFRSSSSAAIEEAVLAGVGIGVLSEVQGRTLDGIVQLDTDEPLPSADIYLAFLRDAKHTPRIRTVVRELEAEMRRLLA